MNLARDVIELLEARASNGRSAFHYVETLFTRIVAALRRDPRFADIGVFELELLLANERCEAEKHLLNETRDRIELEDAKDAVRRCLAGEED